LVLTQIWVKVEKSMKKSDIERYHFLNVFYYQKQDGIMKTWG